MADQFDNWRARLAGEELPIHEDQPESGYWRIINKKKGTILPVAIWRENGEVVCLVNDTIADDPTKVWTWCCRHPVAYETYVAVAERGEPWPDQVKDIPPAIDPVIGHNSGIPAHELLKDQIDTLKKAWAEWLAGIGGTITTQAHADQAAVWAERTGNVEKEVNAAYRIEKDPVVEEGRAIDQRWKPIASEVDETKRGIKAAVAVYLKAQKAAGATTTKTGGKTARAVGLRTRTFVRFTDLPALWAHYRDDPRLLEQQGVHQALLRLCEVDLAASKPVAGAELVTEETAA